MTIPIFNFAIREDIHSLCNEQNNLKPEMFLPTRSEPKATGYDVRCAAPKGIILKPGCYVKIPLGFRMFAPDGWWLKLAPRSGSFMKLHLHALYGTIDETFEDQMIFAAHYLPDECSLLNKEDDKVIKFGERVAQLIPEARQDMGISELSNSDLDKKYLERNSIRGTGGFGSTGQF